jgi:hypothetical protein
MTRPARAPVAPSVATLAILGAVALALALSAGGETPPGERTAAPAAEGPPTEPFEPATPREIARRVAELRRLEFERPPRVRTVSTAEWRHRIERMAREDPGTREKRRLTALEDFLKLSSLAQPGFEAEEATEGIGELVAGLYRPKRNRLIRVEQGFAGPRLDERVIAHELEHALQDQHYPRVLGRLGKGTAERELAVAALVEGDASIVERRYARRHLDIETLELDTSLLSPANLALGLPPALVAAVRFPYTSGADFVAALRRRGGWELVDRAFRDPPTTSEQILHPAKWFDRDEPMEVSTGAAAALGPDWRRLAGVESGELDAILILASGAPADLAKRAGEGWEGGRFEAFRLRGARGRCPDPCREGRASVVVYRWQRPADAAEFAVTAEQYLANRLLEGRRRGLLFPVGSAAAALGIGRRATSIAYAPSAALSRRLAAAAVEGGPTP